jgi:hypothetical protein
VPIGTGAGLAVLVPGLLPAPLLQPVAPAGCVVLVLVLLVPTAPATELLLSSLPPHAVSASSRPASRNFECDIVRRISPVADRIDDIENWSPWRNARPDRALTSFLFDSSLLLPWVAEERTPGGMSLRMVTP